MVFTTWADVLSQSFQNISYGLLAFLPNLIVAIVFCTYFYKYDRELLARRLLSKENVIAQLKSGVNALRMPSDGLVSNWAYMVIASLAWNLKAWYGLVTIEPAMRRDILRMEFKRFRTSFIQIPCQIVATGRRIIYRILTYSKHLKVFFSTFDHIRELRFD